MEHLWLFAITFTSVQNQKNQKRSFLIALYWWRSRQAFTNTKLSRKILKAGLFKITMSPLPHLITIVEFSFKCDGYYRYWDILFTAHGRIITPQRTSTLWARFSICGRKITSSWDDIKCYRCGFCWFHWLWRRARRRWHHQSAPVRLNADDDFFAYKRSLLLLLIFHLRRIAHARD